MQTRFKLTTFSIDGEMQHVLPYQEGDIGIEPYGGFENKDDALQAIETADYFMVRNKITRSLRSMQFHEIREGIIIQEVLKPDPPECP